MLWKTFLFCILTFVSIDQAQACTGIFQKAENESWVYARTMEFGADLISFELLFVPRGIEYISQTPSGEPGVKWTTKYGHVGFNPFGMPIVADGLNEKGLACGAFYFPGWAKYQEVTTQERANTLSNLDFVSWALGNFATVNEVREALKHVKVSGTLFPAWGMIPPLHYFIADKRGDQLVVEYVDGQLKLYDTVLGAITNAPSYDWHMVNARNYIGLQALNRPSIKVTGQEFSQFGQGSGAIGLPGDFTPPSRFIRAAFFNQIVLNGKNALEQVNRAFKILNQFDIPKGAVREMNHGKEMYEETQWTSAADLTGSQYFFHTAASRSIRSVDLKKLDLDAKEIKSMEVNTPETIMDISANFKKR